MTPFANILLIRLKSIGDVVLTLPAANRLRDLFPQARITYLTSKENASVVKVFPAVDEIITLDRAALRRFAPRAVWAGTVGLAWRLRRARFDLVVDLQGYGETALFAWLTGAPQRWGSIYRSGRRWAYTHGVDRDDTLHPADWHLALLRQCGLRDSGIIRNEARLPRDAMEAAKEFFAAHKLDLHKPLLFIQPFTSSPHKDWPLEKLVAVAGRWQAEGVQVIFGGGPTDRVALEPVRQAGFVVSAGVPLLATAALMKLATVVLGPDTGILHLAVAMGRRVVMLIRPHGSGSPVPYQHSDWMVLPPDLQPVAEITVDEVNAAVARALAEVKAASLRLLAGPP